jgi:hypothetical protein
MEPSAANCYLADHVGLLLDSFQRLTGRGLLAVRSSPVAAAAALYDAPFVVLSHDTAADPVFTYANRTAQALFEMPWDEIVGMPSRYSAEPLLREARQRLLDQVSRHGYIDDYQGVRIAKSGRRFLVRRATVWTLLGPDGPRGQAATFADWTPAD